MAVTINVSIDNYDDIIGYRLDMKKLSNGYYGYLTLHSYAPWDVITPIFRKLSTCKEGCGCTGYRPKENCPDKDCVCRSK